MLDDGITTMKLDMVVDLFGSSPKEMANSMLPSGHTESPVNPWTGLTAARRLWGLILIFSRASKYRMSIELPSSIKQRWTKWFPIMADMT